MEEDIEKAYITYDPTEVTREELTQAILRTIEDYTDKKPTLLDELVGENEIVLLIPEGVLAAIVEISGVIRGRSEDVG